MKGHKRHPEFPLGPILGGQSYTVFLTDTYEDENNEFPEFKPSSVEQLDALAVAEGKRIKQENAQKQAKAAKKPLDESDSDGDSDE